MRRVLSRLRHSEANTPKTLLGAFATLLLPVQFAVFTLLSLFQQNETDIELGVLWRPLGLSAAAAVVLWGVLALVFKRTTKGALLASLVVVAFFYYGVFAEHIGLTDRWLLPLWVALFLVAAVPLARTRSDLRNLALVVGVGAVVLVVGPVARIAVYQANHPAVSLSDPRLWPNVCRSPTLPSGAPRPDIYVIVPDDYARIDVLRQWFHYPDTQFLQQLKQRGFVLSPDVRSP